MNRKFKNTLSIIENIPFDVDIHLPEPEKCPKFYMWIDIRFMESKEGVRVYADGSAYEKKPSEVKWYKPLRKIKDFTPEAIDKIFEVYTNNELWWTLSWCPFICNNKIFYRVENRWPTPCKIIVMDLSNKEVREINRDDFADFLTKSTQTFDIITFCNYFVFYVLAKNSKERKYGKVRDLEPLKNYCDLKGIQLNFEDKYLINSLGKFIF